MWVLWMAYASKTVQQSRSQWLLDRKRAACNKPNSGNHDKLDGGQRAIGAYLLLLSTQEAWRGRTLRGKPRVFKHERGRGDERGEEDEKAEESAAAAWPLHLRSKANPCKCHHLTHVLYRRSDVPRLVSLNPHLERLLYSASPLVSCFVKDALLPKTTAAVEGLRE